MKFFNLIVSLALICCLSNCGESNNQEIELVLEQNVGEKYTVVSETEAGDGSNMSINYSMEILIEVKDLEDDIYNYDVEILRIKSDTKMFGEVESYDSSKSESEMTEEELLAHSDFKQYLGEKFDLSMDKKGNITSPFSYKNGRQLEAPLVDMNNIQITFPKTKVKVGSTWSADNVNELTSQTIKTTYELISISSSEITIATTSDIPGMGGMLDSNQATGKYILNRDNCKLKSGTMTMNMQTGGKAVLTYKVI